MNYVCYIYRKPGPWTVTKCKSNLFSMNAKMKVTVEVGYCCPFTVQKVLASDPALIIFKCLLTIKIDSLILM